MAHRRHSLIVVTVLVLHVIYSALPMVDVYANVIPRQVTELYPSETHPWQSAASFRIVGDWLVVGEPAASVHQQMDGRVLVFQRIGEAWALDSIITPPQREMFLYFGQSLGFNGETLVIGAPGLSASDDRTDAGGIFIYQREQGAWQLQQQINNPIPRQASQFGLNIALYGSAFAVTTYGNYPGSVFVYERDSTAWSSVAELRIPHNLPTPIALSATTLLVGDTFGPTVHVFERTPTGWNSSQVISAPPAAMYSSFFGYSLAVNSNYVAIGSPKSNTWSDVGAVYLYHRNGTQWEFETTLRVDHDTEAFSFGTTLALDGESLLVGAPAHQLDEQDDPVLVGEGAAYLFQRSVNGWQLTDFLSPNAQRPVHQFGTLVELDAQRITIQAPRTRNGTYENGTLYTARRDDLARAQDDAVTTPEDQPVTIAVLQNDRVRTQLASPAFVNITLLRQPVQGTVVPDLANGTFIYTPTTDYAGIDTFTYAPGWGSTATVMVSIEQVAEPPIITSSPVITAYHGMQYYYTITGRDADPNDQLRVQANGLPAWLRLQDNADGTAVLSGVPNFGAIGTYPIELVLMDQTGRSAIQRFTLTVQRGVPDSPSELRLAVTSRSTIRLDWQDQSDNELGYTIERQVNGATWQPLASVRATLSFTDTNRTCQTDYAYRVKAFNQYGLSDPSNVETIRVQDCTLLPPSDLRGGPITTDTLYLTWTDQSDNEAGFLIEDSTLGSDDWQIIGRSDTNQPTFQKPGVACATDRVYRVRAVTPESISAPSAPITTNTCAPVAPVNTRVVATSQLSITFGWDDQSDNELGMIIEQRSLDGSTWQPLVQHGNDKTEKAVENLFCGRTRDYRVVAVNGVGRAASEVITVATQPCPAIYVRADATGSKDGSSWSDAFTDLQAALTVANQKWPGTIDVWVAQGTYKPTNGTQRTETFSIPYGVNIYGGFCGTETLITQRNLQQCITTLSGDIGVVGDNKDNSYRVVSMRDFGQQAVMDGFTITAGNSTGIDWQEDYGGGMLVESGNILVRNVIFFDNRAQSGAGLSIMTRFSNSDQYIYPINEIELNNVSFIANQGVYGGGGVAVYGGVRYKMYNVLFSGNVARYGGAIYNFSNRPSEIVNATFVYNNATSMGGAIYSNRNSSQPTLYIKNSVFWGNRGSLGGHISEIYYSTGGWNTPSAVVQDSILEQPYSPDTIQLTRTLIKDPQFIDAAGVDSQFGTRDDNYRLRASSPAIDRGNNAAVPAGITMDLGGQPRIIDAPDTPDSGVGTTPLVDIGAFEFQPVRLPQASINFTVGKPGSAFLVRAQHLQAKTTYTVHINEQAVGSVFTTETGALDVIIQTVSAAVLGVYNVSFTPSTAPSSINTLPSVGYELAVTAPLRTKPIGSLAVTVVAPIAQTPPQPPAQLHVFVPIILR